MTVSSSARRITYAGDAVSKVFNVPFKFLARGDLRLVLRLSSGAESVLALDTDYAVTGAGNDSGGVVTAVTPPPSGSHLLIKRVTPREQPVDFTPFDAFPAETQERALDRGILISQEDGDELSRALTVPETDPAIGSLTVPTVTARASRVMAFDSNGRPVAGPLTNDLVALLAAAFTPGLTSLGSAVTFTAAGAGAETRSIESKARERVSLMDYIPASLHAAIKAGTNTTVLTAFIAAAVAACSDGGTIHVEQGRYRGLWSIPADKTVSIEGDGDASVLEAVLAGDTIMTHARDERREGGRRIQRLRFDGRSLGSVTGVKLGNQTTDGALLQLTMRDVLAENCYAGIELGNVQESSFYDVTCQFNTVGMLCESSPTNGGLTTLSFYNVHWQNNTVGFYAKSASAIAPMSSWLFAQCLAQSNSLAGMAIFGAVSGAALLYGSTALAMHFENNGVGTAPGATQTIRGRVVQRCGCHIEGSVITFASGQLGESLSDVRTFVVRNNSRLTIIDGAVGGGDKANGDCDATSRIILSGVVQMTGSFTGVSDTGGAQFDSPGSLQAKPRRIPSPYPRNQYAGPGLNPNAPEAENAVGCTPSKFLDIDRGDVQRVVFGAGAGSAGSNRVTFKIIGTPVAIGDRIAVEVDVRAAAPMELTLRILGGASSVRAPQSFSIGPEWSCIVIYGFATAAEASGVELYAYPTNAGGGTVDFAEMMVVRVAAGADPDPLHDMIRRGLYDDMKQPVYATGIPTSGTWPRGKRIINSAPAVGQPRAWTKVTTGAGNVLNTDWISEGNL